jgi:hypothetical protein
MKVNDPKTAVGSKEYNQHGLRQRLFEAMDALRRGDIESEEAKATSALAKQIIASDRVEMEIYKMKMLDAKPIGRTNPQEITHEQQ